MKIFFIVPSVTHYRETFFRKLIGANAQHDWLIIDGEKKVDDGRPNYYKQFDFPHKRFEERFRKLGPFSLRDYVGLLDFIRQEKPDLVIAPGIPGTSAYRSIARLARSGAFRLAIWSCLWEHPDVKKSMLRGIKQIVSAKYLRTAEHHLVYSSYARKRLLQFGCKEDKIFIAYNGIELDGLEQLRLEEAQKKTLRQRLGIDDAVRIFICVGGLGPDKRVDLLLQAVSVLKQQNVAPFVLLIIGNGPMEQQLKAYASANGLKQEVQFLGRIVDGVDDYFQLSDCLVVPGAGGLSLNQAMYWQKTCIVAHADGTEEDLVTDSVTGFRFEENNASSLMNAMLRFMNTSQQALQEMGTKGKKLIEEQSNVDQMVRTFSKVITLPDS